MQGIHFADVLRAVFGRAWKKMFREKPTGNAARRLLALKMNTKICLFKFKQVAVPSGIGCSFYWYICFSLGYFRVYIWREFHNRRCFAFVLTRAQCAVVSK